MRWLALVLLAQVQPLNGNVQPVIVKDEGVKQQPYSATTLDCVGAGITCTQTSKTMTLTVPGGGGSGGKVAEAFAADASITAQYLTITCGAGQFVTCSGSACTCATPAGGGGSANFVAGVATFDGGSSDTTASVTAAWASGSSALICTADGEEASLEALQVVPLTRSAGSFTVRASIPLGSHAGDLPFTCTGN